MMRPAIDKHTFANAAEMRKHYAEVHKRLYGPASNGRSPVVKREGKPLWVGLKVDRVLSVVADFYHIQMADLLMGKTAALTNVRYVSMYLAYHVGRKSIRHISKVMGYHFNTVLEGVQKLQFRRKCDAVLNAQVNELAIRLKALPL